ncbi:MAG: hypothetical protein K0R78_2279 [Pelosinus sp.]|jgi:hypothetical protein|nr:hypothetical protein [Pelosinus sp.]
MHEKNEFIWLECEGGLTVQGDILANKNAKDRSPTEFYPTPKNVTVALMEYLELPDCTIWEPACGQGHMSEALRELGYGVIPTELHDRGYGSCGIDYLETINTPGYCDWIITNPPFSLSEQFIRKSIEHGKPFAMLLKSQYWHSAKRRILFEEFRPQAVLPLTWRPDFLFGSKSGSPTMECIWTVWGTESAKETIYRPLIKPAV